MGAAKGKAHAKHPSIATRCNCVSLASCPCTEADHRTPTPRPATALIVPRENRTVGYRHSCGLVRPLRSRGMSTRLGYQCCYCGEAISETDRSALRINLSGILGGKRGATQDMFAHSPCAAGKFGAALHSSVPFDVEVFEPDE